MRFAYIRGMESIKGSGWQIEAGQLTITLDGPAAGTYTVRVPVPQDHPQAGSVILVGSKDSKPVYVRLAPRPELAAAIKATLAAERDAYLATETRCDRCGCHVDGRSCYRQAQWTRLGGSRIKATAYYCSSCAGLLQTIGRGELSAMDERAADRPDMTPDSKQD